jgi:hypothetical protein
MSNPKLLASLTRFRVPTMLQCPAKLLELSLLVRQSAFLLLVINIDDLRPKFPKISKQPRKRRP